MTAAMPPSGMILVNAATEIIETHQPDEASGHWANERFCKGCSDAVSLRVWPWSDFPRHQSELIVEYVRNSLGCR